MSHLRKSSGKLALIDTSTASATSAAGHIAQVGGRRNTSTEIAYPEVRVVSSES